MPSLQKYLTVICRLFAFISIKFSLASVGYCIHSFQSRPLASVNSFTHYIYSGVKSSQVNWSLLYFICIHTRPHTLTQR